LSFLQSHGAKFSRLIYAGDSEADVYSRKKILYPFRIMPRSVVAPWLPPTGSDRDSPVSLRHRAKAKFLKIDGPVDAHADTELTESKNVNYENDGKLNPLWRPYYFGYQQWWLPNGSGKGDE
jgi:hypothetical protein